MPATGHPPSDDGGADRGLDAPRDPRGHQERRAGQRGPEVAVDRFRSAHATSPIGFALLNERGHMLHANPALCRMLDAAEAELLHRPLTDLVHPSDSLLVDDSMADLLGGASSARVVLRLEADVGAHRWADVTVHLIRDRSSEPYLYTVHIEDQTDHVEVLGQLGHAARVSLAGEMAPGIGHDLRNALTAIGANLDFMAGEQTDPANLERIKVLSESVHRAHSLAGQLINLVHPGPPSRELIDLGGMVSALEPILRTMADPEVTVEVLTEPALVAGDPIELERVLLTLVANALDAIDGPGKVTVEVSRRSLDEPDGETRRCVQLRVTDTGQGMDAETLARAFEPYFTTKRTGTGLGLASSRSLVEALGGTIDISTETGAGSVVDVHLADAGRNDDPEPD